MFNEDAECGPGDGGFVPSRQVLRSFVLSLLVFCSRLLCGVWPLLLAFHFFLFFNSKSVRFCAAASVLFFFPAFVCEKNKSLFSFMYFVYSLILIK